MYFYLRLPIVVQGCRAETVLLEAVFVLRHAPPPAATRTAPHAHLGDMLGAWLGGRETGAKIGCVIACQRGAWGPGT